MSAITKRRPAANKPRSNEAVWLKAHRKAARLVPHPPYAPPKHASEPVFSCAECVSLMDEGHWERVGENGAVVLRALRGGGPGTFGEVIRRVLWSNGDVTPATVRRKAPPLYQLMQALTTLVAQGLVKTKRIQGAPTKPLLETLSQFEFWCDSCETYGKLVYKRRPERNGMTGRHYNKRRMVLECRCGAVHAEQRGTRDKDDS
jgi:hypothetical protein